MPKIDVYNIEGKKVSDLELKEEIFGIEPNEALVHSVLVNYLANQRQGTQSTKTRSEVSGGGKKPWKQKGTGRARFGSTRNPIWRHGGVAFGRTGNENFTKKLSKTSKRVAVMQALSIKNALDESIRAIDFHSVSTPTEVAARIGVATANQVDPKGVRYPRPVPPQMLSGSRYYNMK